MSQNNSNSFAAILKSEFIRFGNVHDVNSSINLLTILKQQISKWYIRNFCFQWDN